MNDDKPATHPHQLAAITALSSLCRAYPRLAEIAEAEAYQRHDARRRSSPRRDPGDRARTQEAALLRQERADRIHSARRSIRHLPAAPAPIRAALLDAQIRAQVTVETLCWDAAERLRTQPPPYVAPWWRAYIRYHGWDDRCAYLAEALRLVPPTDAERAARQLERTDQAVRAALSIGPDRRLLPGDPPCPACGRQTLRAEVSSLNEHDWTISCAPDCRCTGVQCACRRPDREPGQPHLWPVEEYAANFGELRPYLRAMRAVEAGAITRDGIVYVTAEQLVRVLGATPGLETIRAWQTRLRDWHRHGRVDAVKIGRTNWYRLDQAHPQAQGRARTRA